MSLENDNNNRDFNEFLQSLQEDKNETASQEHQKEEFSHSFKEDDNTILRAGKNDTFPFADSFDIDSFVKENGISSSEADNNLSEIKKETSIPSGTKDTSNNMPDKEDYSFLEEYAKDTPDIAGKDVSYTKDFSIPNGEEYHPSGYGMGEDIENDDLKASYGPQSIKGLQQRISELESRLEDANKEKNYYTKLQDEIEFSDNIEENGKKDSDEFYKNISSTIDTLKGSLKSFATAKRGNMFNDIATLRGSIENIVNARLQYEESLIAQDQNLISRLREKTNRLKSINLALNSEVKRSKDEKLEALRKSAEQTKELLSLRVQLNKVEEKARLGDFKLSKMEQHLSMLNQEKFALDEEIRKIRAERLASLRKTSEQSKEIMNLRLVLSKTEEQFKQEEIQNTFMKEQLSSLEDSKAALEKEFFATRAEKEAAQRELLKNTSAINKLKEEIKISQEKLDCGAKEAGSLREEILSLETKLRQMNTENAALALKGEESLKQLEAARSQYEQDIASLKSEQLYKIEQLKKQKAEETQSITLELRRAEDKYRQEETFVNTLKLQIESLRNDIASLDQQKRAYEGKSENLARDIEFIKETHLREIESLKQELDNSSKKLTREQNAYQALKDKLFSLEDEKTSLNNEIRRILSEKDEALSANEKYIREIEVLKKEHSALETSLKEELSKMNARHEQDLAAYNELKAKEEALRRSNLGYQSQISEISAREEGLKHTNADYLSKLNEYSAKITELENKREQILKEKSGFELELKNKQESYFKEIADYKRRIETLKTEHGAALSNLTLEISNLKTENNNKVSSLVMESSSLRKEKQNLINELNTIKNAFSNKETENSRLGFEIQNLKDIISGKENETLNLNNEIGNLKNEISGKEKENNSLAGQIVSLKSGLDGKEKENTRLNSEINSLKDIINSKESEVQNLTGQINGLRSSVADKEKENTALLGQINNLKENLVSKEEINTGLNAEIESLKKTIADKEASNTGLTGEMSVLKAEISSLKESLAGKENAAADLSKEISALKNGISEREAQNILLGTQISSLQEKISGRETQAVALSNEVQTLKESLTAKEQETDNLSSEIKSLKDTISGKESEIANLKGEIDNLIKNLASREENNALLNAEILSLKNSFDAKENEAAGLAKEIETLKGNFAVKEAEKADFIKQIDALRKEIADKNNNSSKILESVQSLKTSIAQKDALSSNLSNEIENLKKELETQKRIQSELSAKLVQAQAENEKKLSEIKDFNYRSNFAENKIAEITSALMRAENTVKENEGIITMLKGEVSSASAQTSLINVELKKAQSEKYEILKQLEEKTKALADFQQRYEQEVSSLKEAQAKAAEGYEEKLKAAQKRLEDETKTVETLKEQIAVLEEEKNRFNDKLSGSDMRAHKIIEQADEIISLKSKLAKAENRFLQDTVLIGQLKEQFSDSRENVARLENEIHILKEENAKAQKELGLKEEEIQRLSKALAESEQKVREEHSAVEQLQEHTSKLKEVNAALDEEVKKAQGEKLEALRKSADQAREILLLKQQLSEVETKYSLNFEDGIVSIRKEYEEKVEKLETELKDASALCAKQVKELEELKTDNSRLKSAEEEKLKLQSSYDVLSQKAVSLEGELESYKKKEAAASTLAKAKAAALSAQIAKITKEKASLKDQLSKAQEEIEHLTAKEKETAEALNSLKEKISGNDIVIANLKKEIVVLKAENRELKEAAESTHKREQALQDKMAEVEQRNKTLSTSLNLAKEDAAKMEKSFNKMKAAHLQAALENKKAKIPQKPNNGTQKLEQNKANIENTNIPQPPKAPKAAAKAVPAAKDGGAKSGVEQQTTDEKDTALQQQTAVAENVAGQNTAEQKQPAGIQEQPADNAETFPTLIREPSTKTSAFHDDSAEAIAAFDEPVQSVEEVEIESNAMDLSLIFGDESKASEESEKEEDIPTATNPAIEQVKATTVKKPLPSIAEIQQSKNAYEEMEVQDHSVKSHGGVIRKPAPGRLPPTYRNNEAYSDFLKKTRSVFYRIKWSLFKE